MADPKPTGQPTIGTQFNPNPSDVDWKAAEKQLEAEISAGLQEFRAALELSWREKVQQNLKTTSDEYLRNLSFSVKKDSVEATLTGWLPVALETGAERFDMKPGLLKGRQSRIIPMADGEFRTVSQFSPRDSWWHPGFQARGFGEQVKQEAPAIAEKIFKPIFDRIKI